MRDRQRLGQDFETGISQITV